MNFRVFLRGLAFIVSLVALGFLAKALHLDAVFDTAWIDADVKGRGLEGEMLYLGAGALLTGVGFPRQAVAFLGGYAFGVVEGTAWSLAATGLGCVGSFFYARFLGRRLVASRFPGKVKRIDDFLHDNPFSMTLLIRLLPVGSNVATNLLAGVSRVRPLPFLAGSLVGYMPQNLVFALSGSGVTVDSQGRIAVGVVLFVLSGLLGVYLYHRYRHGKSLDADIDRQIGEETLP
ncbi:MAG: VTT domain-containing protein [Magnetospirillum sp. WYHS-4]